MISTPTNASISKITSSLSNKSAQNGIDTALKRDNFYATYRTNRKRHKSLDFSNLGMGKEKEISLRNLSASSILKTATTDNSEKDFRRFHQMTLFIENAAHFTHGKETTDTMMITSNLPEKISYKLASKWEQPLNFESATFNLIMQMAGGEKAASGVTRAASLKVWNGTEPLSLDLTIPVIDDGSSSSGTNLVEALEVLGSLVLPRYNNNTTLGFYTPPPSPLNVNIQYEDYNSKQNVTRALNPINGNARILLQLGGILLIDRCIIEEVEVTYPNTKALIMHEYNTGETFGNTKNRYLHPLLAEVHLRISTIEALTADNYSNMLWAKSTNSMGQFDVDVTRITSAANSALRWVRAENNTGE